MIGKSFKLLRGFEESACTFLRSGRKFGPPQVSDHQRVSAQQKPRFRAAGFVCNEERNVFRSMSRSVQDLDQHVPEIENVTFVGAKEVVPCSCTGM